MEIFKLQQDEWITTQNPKPAAFGNFACKYNSERAGQESLKYYNFW